MFMYEPLEDSMYDPLAYRLRREFLLLQRNDPCITTMKLAPEFNVYDGIGSAVGNSLYLNKLTLMNVWDEDMYLGLAQNRSIESLDMELSGDVLSGPTPDIDVFYILSPFFEHNPNLRHVAITLIDLNERLFGSLVSALSKSKVLHSIQFNSIDDTEEDLAAYQRAAALFRSLRGMSSLLSITYDDIMNSIGCRALTDLLDNPACRVHSIELNNNYLEDDSISILCNSPRVKSNLSELDLTMNNHVTTTGWRALFTVLSHPMCSLKLLCLNDTNMDDQGVTYLGDALAGNKTLSWLSLSTNKGVTTEGWRGFSNCLRSTNCALRKLYIEWCNIDAISAGIFFTALTGNSNSRLQELHMTNSRSDLVAVADMDWNLLSCLLCDKSSIDSTYSSNHTLHTVIMGDGDIDPIPRDIMSILELNTRYDKSSVWRTKILKYNSSRSGSDFRPFAEMSETVLPIAIEWIGRDHAGFQLMYEVVKGCPHIIISALRATSDNAKRKREI
jgi:hypothetical protein